MQTLLNIWIFNSVRLMNITYEIQKKIYKHLHIYDFKNFPLSHYLTLNEKVTKSVYANFDKIFVNLIKSRGDIFFLLLK